MLSVGLEPFIMRQRNFSKKELDVMFLEFEKNKSTLQSKLSQLITKQTKDRIWEAITEKVNAVSDGPRRTSGEIRKKWSNICSEKKKKLSSHSREARKTGGGPPPPPLTEEDTAFIPILGKSAISGVEGGIDVSEPAPSPPTEDPEVSRHSFSQQQDAWDLSCNHTAPMPREDRCNSLPLTFNESLNTSNKSTDVSYTKSKRKRDDTETLELIGIEQERLEVEKKRLQVEQKILDIEEKRLKIDEERLRIEKDKYTLYAAKLSGMFGTVQVIENMQ